MGFSIKSPDVNNSYTGTNLLPQTYEIHVNKWMAFLSQRWSRFCGGLLNKHASADKSLPIYSLSNVTDSDKLSIIRPNETSGFMEKVENRSFLVECGSLNNILLLKRSSRPYFLFVSPLFQISCSFAFISARGRYSREFWIGVCREGSWTLTLFD